MFDKKIYYQYSKNLETFAITKFATLMLVFIIGGYFIGEYILKNNFIGIIIGIIVGTILLYSNYLKEQIKVEEMKMMLEIHSKLINKD